jgi:hypothetical protein
MTVMLLPERTKLAITARLKSVLRGGEHFAHSRFAI